MFFFEPVQVCQPRRHCAVRNRPHHLHHFNNLVSALADLIDTDAATPDHASSHIHYEENGDFHLKCEVAGFKHEELSVDLDGDELVVSGEHKELKDEESLERSFKRRIRLPKELDVAQIKCEMDGETLRVSLPRKQPAQAPKQKIPINVKEPAAEQQQ